MPERREIAATARQMLGRMAFVMVREYGLLARLLHEGEEIEAMALSRIQGGGLVGSQRLVVATSDRLLFVEKGFITGRERIEDVAWEDVHGAHPVPPSRLELELREGPLTLTFVQPPRQLGALADAIRRRLDPESAATTTTSELLDLAHLKLGRMTALGAESNIIALGAALHAAEPVLDLAWASQDEGGLLAATDRRVLFVPSSRFGGAKDPMSLPYGEIEAVELDEEGTLSIDQHRWPLVVPPERAEALVQRVIARLR